MKAYSYDYDDELDIDIEELEDSDTNPPDTLQNLGLSWSDFV